MDIVNGRTYCRTDKATTIYALPSGIIKKMSNAPPHVLAQAAVVAAYKLLDH